jgi:hypothetical protein
MSRFFKRLLGFILLLSTMGLTTCQSVVKAEPILVLAKPADQLLPGNE